ncbi:nuclear envelope pore membrane protein POM 121-like isoform X2 [Manis javanica]|uniref:nuclear envelope pore membrane protein POM 121-like isoform X2 n=1 Tax=Manis javanica TaxID=9974 RepID=UPI003C6CF43B
MPSSSWPHRRKFQLVPSRRGIPLILPPAPMFSYSITTKDFERETQAQSQWLKSILEDKTGCSPFPSEKEQDQKHKKDVTSLAVQLSSLQAGQNQETSGPQGEMMVV